MLPWAFSCLAGMAVRMYYTVVLLEVGCTPQLVLTSCGEKHDNKPNAAATVLRLTPLTVRKYTSHLLYTTKSGTSWREEACCENPHLRLCRLRLPAEKQLAFRRSPPKHTQTCACVCSTNADRSIAPTATAVETRNSNKNVCLPKGAPRCPKDGRFRRGSSYDANFFTVVPTAVDLIVSKA